MIFAKGMVLYHNMLLFWDKTMHLKMLWNAHRTPSNRLFEQSVIWECHVKKMSLKCLKKAFSVNQHKKGTVFFGQYLFVVKRENLLHRIGQELQSFEFLCTRLFLEKDFLVLV